jgi:hypothetical protein
MSTYTILALVILPILGGFIAWVGDVMGYRLGKSRRSLFGLRPRSTARLMAVVVGVALPLLTMLVAALGSQNVRIALFQLDQLRASEQQLSEKNTQLQGSVQAAETLRDQAREAYAKADKQLELAKVRLQAAQKEVTAAEGRLREAQGQLAGTQKSLATAQSSLAQTQARLAQNQKDLAQANTNLAQARTDEVALRRQADDLRATVAELKAQADQQRAEVTSTRRELEKAQRDLDTVNEAYTKAQADLKRLQDQKQQYMFEGLSQFILTGTTDVRYEIGAELCRGFVDSSQTNRQIESSLGELLVLASDTAAAKGAQPGETGRAVILFAPPPDDPQFPPSEEKILHLVAAAIKQARTPEYVVSVRVVFRSFVGDERPVAVGFYAQPNTLIYPKGTVILHPQIDGTQPRAKVFEQVMGLIGTLRTASQQAGILPDTDTGQYGEVFYDQLLGALDEIVARKRTVTLEAVATENVYVASRHPFRVRLQLSPAAGTPGG